MIQRLSLEEEAHLLRRQAQSLLDSDLPWQMQQSFWNDFLSSPFLFPLLVGSQTTHAHIQKKPKQKQQKQNIKKNAQIY